MEYLIFGCIAYLLGSVPTAVWVGKSYYKIDIREHGSKNAGATNTFRVLGKKPGIIVLCVDIMKGALAVLLPYFILGETLERHHMIHIELICALMAVIGHVFPLFAGFRGGKGVATSLGVIIGLHPPAAFICLGLFLVVFIVSKYVSLGAITAAIAFPLLIIFYFKSDSFWLNVFSIILSAVVIFAHRKNIGRLVKGTEGKMSLFKKSESV